jgi:hypothetical protein
MTDLRAAQPRWTPTRMLLAGFVASSLGLIALTLS